MVILHIIDVANLKGNGVAVAVNEYIKVEKKKNNVALYDLKSQFISDDFKCFHKSKFETISCLPSPFCNPDLIVFNEIYKPLYIKLYKECDEKKIKYIIIPHGSLVREAQKKHVIKKVLGNIVLFNRFINHASAIQFLNLNEKNNSKFKMKKSIIIGNGTSVPLKIMNKPLLFNFVYIGRYDIHVKGLDLIIKMCSKYKVWLEKRNVKINLYGRKTGRRNEVIESLNKMIKTNSISNIVKLHDAVYDDKKIQVLNEAYAFIQTSRHEGQPMGIIEALSYGIPCIVTTGTTFAEIVNSNNCGIGIAFDEKQLFEAIKKIIDDEKKRKIMSNNAYKYAKNNYDWNIIEEKINDEYFNLVRGN